MSNPKFNSQGLSKLVQLNSASSLSLISDITDKHGRILSRAPTWPQDSGQDHENDIAELVVVCQPGLPKLMGSMHPAGSLYEKPVNTQESTEQHQNFQRVLVNSGITVLDVKEILILDTDKDLKARIELEIFAASRMKYLLSETCDERLLKAEERFYIGDKYKQQVIEAMSSEQLVDIIMTNPTVHVQPSFRDTGFTASYSFHPLTNMVFTRDQQVTTRKGIVMCRLSSSQRQNEVDLMKFCWKKLGLNIIGEIPEPGRLEGGDFFPAGKGLCYVGVGLRSNFEAVDYMLKNDLFGTDKVVVVKDDFEKSQDRMHLDCVFNILSDNCCLMYEDMMGEQSPVRRLVDEWSKNDKGVYTKTLENVEFSKYILDKDISIIAVSKEDQLKYGCNVLNLGGGNVVAVHEKTARKIANCPAFKGTVRSIQFDGITNMYGAVHCASQVVKRRKGIKPGYKRKADDSE